MPKEQIAKAAVIILFGTIIGKIAGFIREILIAKYFGASFVTDAFFVAYNIPMLLIFMVVSGGVYSALVPIFTKYLTLKEYKILWRLSSIIINYAIIISFGIVIVIIIFAPYLVKFLGYGLGKEAFELAVKLSRLMAPVVIFTGLAAILIGILHSFQHFIVPSFNAFILATTVIICILSLSKNLGIFSVGIGLIIGSGLMFLALLAVLLKKKMEYSFNLNFRYPELKEFVHLFIPAAASTAISNLYVIVTRMMASPLQEGSIAALDFANMIIQTPLSTFGLAISTAIFPFIASYATTKDYESLKGTMLKGIRMTALIYIPIGLIFMVLCVPIIRLLFERGNFDTHDTMMTSQALFFYAIGIIALGVNFVLIRVFYAIHDAITPMVSTIIGVLFHILLNFILIKYLAHAGIALSTSIAHIFTNFILFWVLRYKIGHIGTKQILNSFWKMLFASLPAVLLCFLISRYIESTLDISKIEFQILQVATAITLGLISYLIILWLLKADELKMIIELIKSKFKKET
jgi:putative peptidoglycan lipid II flippase